MPLAADDAPPAHHVVPDAVAPHGFACPATGHPCPALAAVFGQVDPASEAALGWLGALAPCAGCRIACEHRLASLRHVRLGQREREILSGAAQSPVYVVTESGMSRSLSASRRRAAISLGKVGLVAPIAGGESSLLRAAVSLTELGRYVMGAYGRFIVGGKAVRWTRPLKGVPLPGRDPSDLAGVALHNAEAALRDTLRDLKGVLVAAISGRFKDPGQLDTVTRHLEDKAILLRSVLGPGRAAAPRLASAR